MGTGYASHERFLVAVDCIIFGFDGRELNVLVVRRGFAPEQGQWSLVGGFVNSTESADAAAQRILTDLTGLRKVYLEQVHCFSDVDRDPAERVVSIAYFALIRVDADGDAVLPGFDARWFPIRRLPRVIFDHRKMIQMALKSLGQRVVTHPVGFELLPDKFTLPQLQCLYEAIFGTALDKRNFSRKILSLGILRKLDEKEKTTSRKGAFLYVFDKERYRKLQDEGVKFL